jgi:predicted Rossmann fold flavoprotein
MVKDKKIVVIGAGAAGMMAAGQAALNGHDVLLLEKMRRPGRKLAITGKGRCNLTNSAKIADFIASFGKKGRFLRQAFGSFFSNDLVNFFEEIGVPLVTERGGRIFPKSGKAPEVVTALEKWIDKCGVTLQTGSTVQKILIEDNRITGVVANGSKINADAVIIATGGASYPRTGSTGDGYEFAKLAGHTITPIRPALVPLEAKNGTSHLDGLNLRNINAKCFIDGKKFREEFGELTFIDGTVSGPVILKMSGDIVDALRNSQNVEIAIDLKPALEEQKLDRRLVRDFTTRGKEPLKSVLRGLIPRELVGEILANLAIDGNKSVSTITSKERKQIRNWLKNFRIEITGYRPFGEAIITAGGVVTKEVNPKTMESKMVTGLYITGEVLDLNATTGGYNLQAAFSTGYLAGQLI